MCSTWRIDKASTWVGVRATSTGSPARAIGKVMSTVSASVGLGAHVERAAQSCDGPMHDIEPDAPPGQLGGRISGGESRRERQPCDLRRRGTCIGVDQSAFDRARQHGRLVESAPIVDGNGCAVRVPVCSNASSMRPAAGLPGLTRCVSSSMP
jgi:hypothetical protein